MNDIIDDKEELFDIYKAHFSWGNCDAVNLRKEFDGFINNKIDYMPYFFVNELIFLGYTIDNEQEQLDESF